MLDQHGMSNIIKRVLRLAIRDRGDGHLKLLAKIPVGPFINSNRQSFILYRTYRVAEGGGDQGGHDDHGDNDLDGGGGGSSHVGVLYVSC